ncbi:MAG TPA: IS200/IS605 family transposase [Anaerolineales bacterium]|nr:IS200/IS605 family transposase [Anaerolineales bacterium]
MPYWRLFYHAVWATKNRLELIDPAWEKDLYGYIWGKATALECIPHAIGGMPEHTHIAISIPPKLCVATLIGQLKGASSHYINEKYAGGSFLWQAEYGVLSFSEKSLSRVVDYINNQKKHHAENTLNIALENLALDGLKL